jgi:hypothetical protein
MFKAFLVKREADEKNNCLGIANVYVLCVCVCVCVYVCVSLAETQNQLCPCFQVSNSTTP